MDQANALRDRIRLKTQDVFEHNRFANNLEKARVITITSGKGGVGKTNVALNLAINIRNKGKDVILIDADFGLANAEVLFGKSSESTILDLLKGEKSIEEIILDGPNGIKLLSGGAGIKELADITDAQMYYLIRNFSLLDNRFDYIIIDTGAGASSTVVNFAKAAHEIIVVTTPEPTSITDSYGIVKAIVENEESPPNFKLITNKTESDEEGLEVYYKLRMVLEKFLGLELEYLGCLPDDNNLVKSVKRQEPVSLLYPNTSFSKSIEQLSMKLLEIEPEKESKGFLSYMKKLIDIFND